MRRFVARRSFVRPIALLLGCVLLASCELGGSFKGMAVDPPREMPTFVFTRADGSRFSTSPEPGRPMVLFFGYTHCPDVCPTTLADWKRVRASLGDKAKAVRFVFVTVDPERDTPALAERYARMYDAAFEGVSGDAITTSRMMDAFGVAAAREAGTDATGYLVSHSSQVFLVDSHGKLVALYPFGTGWDALAADLERLQ
ncbi:SCO family protein [Gemmatimonas groenlandica]|uniref:SCO family protein n=1 Tax=Gemmatimonas groenlandica TaxID=2732249 RepID=A0A6M4IUW3_9BACT|nr:SCO family protein [Gemmatimonas groenlandica]QJR37958.1 SCO family protein [Gemmatimonas groenlandica]